MKRAEYDKKIFEAFIATPKKYDWYRKAFAYFDSRDGKASWYWSTWAFIGGFWYLMYRKQMKWALIFIFVFSLAAFLIPIRLIIPVYLLMCLLVGGFGAYLVYSLYRSKREEIEEIIKEDEKRIYVMQTQVGGVNRWALPVSIFSLISFVLIVIGLMMAAGKTA